LAVRFVPPEIPAALTVRNPEQSARARQFPRLARLAPPGADRGRDRRGGHVAVRRLKVAAAWMAWIPLVVVQTFPRRG
jgi:hypothetical protein